MKDEKKTRRARRRSLSFFHPSSFILACRKRGTYHHHRVPRHPGAAVMANEPATDKRGAWTVVEELLDRGDPAFVDQLRRLHDCDKLGAFAAPWDHDRRPAARRLLLDYLDRPLNAP